MKIWWTYKMFELWVWFGHKVVGWDTITLHNSKDGERVLGITFGETKEKKK